MRNENQKKGHLYGARAVLEAMRAGRQIDKIFLRKGLDNELRKDVADLANERDIPIQVVPVERIESLARDVNHQGVFAYTSVIGYSDLEELLISLKERKKQPLLIMLDGVTDVRNFGAIARTAECMGADAVVVPMNGSARINADAMKASAGALNHIAVCRVKHLADAVYMLQQYEVKIAAITEKTGDPLFDADLSGPLALIFGAEDRGIEKRILRIADVLAAIPMEGQIESLNVSVSVGMAVLEAVRQRRQS